MKTLLIIALLLSTGCDGHAEDRPDTLIPPSRPIGLGDAPNRYDGKGLLITGVVKDLSYRIYDLEQEVKALKAMLKEQEKKAKRK